jgi:hypothetical protein
MGKKSLIPFDYLNFFLNIIPLFGERLNFNLTIKVGKLLRNREKPDIM